MTNEILQSSALAEASADSLAELLNRDPEGYAKQDRARIISAYRDLRAKMERANAEEAQKPKAPRAKKVPASAPAIVPASAEELDL